MTVRWLRIVGVTALLVVLGLAATWAARQFGGDDHTLAVTGNIEATQVDVSAKITGRIVELGVREGQPVERGQLLVRLDTDELAAEVRRAEAAVRTAEAQLRDLRAGARPQEIQEAEAQAARAESQLDDLLAGARVQDVERARAELRNAAATREWTERDYGRARELHGKDLVAAQEIDRTRQAFEVARANEDSARERLALVEAGARKDEVQAARAAVRAARERVQLLRAGPRADAVAALEAQLMEARAAVALARTRLGETRLMAPIAGVVLRKNMEAGETTNPRVPVLTLVDPRDMWLRAYVPETDIGRVRVGQRATLSVDAYPGRSFVGEVSEIASEAEFTPKNVQTKKERVNLVFRIKIAIENPQGVLKPGMPADAELL